MSILGLMFFAAEGLHWQIWKWYRQFSNVCNLGEVKNGRNSLVIARIVHGMNHFCYK